MAYQYVLRKYKLPKGQLTRYEAMKLFRELEAAGELVVTDEFAIEEKPKGWWKQLVKQLLG